MIFTEVKLIYFQVHKALWIRSYRKLNLTSQLISHCFSRERLTPVVLQGPQLLPQPGHPVLALVQPFLDVHGTWVAFRLGPKHWNRTWCKMPDQPAPCKCWILLSIDPKWSKDFCIPFLCHLPSEYALLFGQDHTTWQLHSLNNLITPFSLKTHIRNNEVRRFHQMPLLCSCCF